MIDRKETIAALKEFFEKRQGDVKEIQLFGGICAVLNSIKSAKKGGDEK